MRQPVRTLLGICRVTSVLLSQRSGDHRVPRVGRPRRVHRRIVPTVGHRLRPGHDALKAIQPVLQISTGMDTEVVAF
jgi:hypothetical protein